MIPFSAGSKIKHIKTGKVYTVIHVGRVKIGDLWDDCLTYENREGEKFTRAASDFNGFILFGI